MVTSPTHLLGIHFRKDKSIDMHVTNTKYIITKTLNNKEGKSSRP